MTETSNGSERPPKKHTRTHCPYCALQCGMTLSVSGDPEVVAEGHEFASVDVEARDFPTNRGAMCAKGWSAAELLSARDRLRSPLLRRKKGGELEPVTWDEAIDAIGAKLEDIGRLHGPNAVGVFGGGGLTNETAYTLGKFARLVLRTRNIDYNGRFCMASAAVATQRALGVDRGLPFPVSDLPKAEVILVVGANPAETMPPLMQYFDEQLSRGGKLIVVDPRRTATAEYATTHLQITPGTDAALANGLLYVAITDGLINEEFIRDRTEGFEAVRRSVGLYWPDRVERITGLGVKQILEAAHLLGRAGSACVLTARGVEQQSHGVENVLSFINLTLALGHFGKSGSGFGCLTGQGNGQGGREHGQKSDQLPGYRRLDNPEHRQWVARVWGVETGDLPPPGPSACELLDAIGSPDGARALLVMGSNLVVSAPDASHVESRLKALDMLIVCDAFMSETAQLADVVLPVCHWAEHDGTMTNLEGRLLLRQRAVPAPHGVLTDLQILERIAERLGKQSFVSSDSERVFEELARASAGGVADYSGFTYARLRRDEELFWPCPSGEHPGTPRLFFDRFPTESGRARFHVAHYVESAERVNEEYPFYLTTGRLLAHYQSGTQTHRVSTLEAMEPEPFVQIHPDLASTFRLADGDCVALRTRRGRAVLRVKLSTKQRLDTVFVPFHWSGAGRANTLTSRRLDPSSKIPEFKLSAVAIEKLHVVASKGGSRTEDEPAEAEPLSESPIH